MPIFTNKLSNAKYSSIFKHLFQTPLLNSACYLNYLQRMHVSGPHARPVFRGPYTTRFDPKTNEQVDIISPRENILAYSPMKEWAPLFNKLTDMCGSPTIPEIAVELYGVCDVAGSDLTGPMLPLTLKKKGAPVVIIEETGLENIPKATLGGDIPYAILGMTLEEYNARLQKLDELFADIDRIGIEEGSGRIRDYVCSYQGPLGHLSASEILANFPSAYRKAAGKSQLVQNEAAHDIVVKSFTPRNDEDSEYLRADTGKSHPFAAWINAVKSGVPGTGEEANFEISGSYTGHVANAVIFKLNNGKTVILLSEAEMVTKYLVEKPDGSLEERVTGQSEIESPNVVNRMHEPLYLSTEPSSISGVYDAEEVDVLINDHLMASGSVNYYVERPLSNPRAAFGIAAFLTMGNGLPVGPYIAEGGREGNASNCVVYNELINFVGGGAKSESTSLQYGRMDEVTILTESGRNYAKYFGDRYLQSLKKIFKLTSVYSGNVNSYLKLKMDNELVDKMSQKNKVAKARELLRDEILHSGYEIPERLVEKPGATFHLNEAGKPQAAEEHFFLTANSISFLAIKNRALQTMDSYYNIPEDDRKNIAKDELAIIDKIISFNKNAPKGLNKVLNILSTRNSASIMVAVAALSKGLVGKSDNKEENLAVELIEGDMMFVAEEVKKGNVPDVTRLDGRIPPQ